MKYHKQFRVKPGARVRLKEYDPDDTGGLRDKSEAEKPMQKNLRAAVGFAVSALRGGPARAADRAPGDGRGRQGRHGPACDVGPEPAELPRDVVQGPVGDGTGARLPLAHPRRRCRRRARSASSTGRITRTSSSRACMGSSARKSGAPATSQINRFEEILSENDIRILKFFLHISKAEQRKRLEERLKDPAKNWKISPRRPGGAQAVGRVRRGLRGGAQPLQHRARRRGSSSRRTTNGSATSPSRRSSSRRSRRWT